MRIKLVSFFLLTCLAMSGCTALSSGSSSTADPVGSPASTNTQFQYHDFSDILVPNEMDFNVDDSFFIGTGSDKLGIMEFEGRVEYKSLATTFIDNMSNDGWKLVFNFVASPKSVLIFAKPTRFCVAKIYDGTTTTKFTVDVYPVRGSEKVISPRVRPAEEPAPLKESALPE